VNIISAHKNTAAETVRKFVETILSNLDEMAEMNPLFAGLADLFEPLRTQGRTALEFGGAPLQPGGSRSIQKCRVSILIDSLGRTQ
jgi:hypothetical protein